MLISFIFGVLHRMQKATDRAGKSPFDTLQNYHNRAIVIIIITNNITHNSVIKPLLCYYTARKYCQNAAYFLLILAYTTLKPQIAHTGRFGILVPYKLTLLSNCAKLKYTRVKVLVPYKLILRVQINSLLKSSGFRPHSVCIKTSSEVLLFYI